jgi:hypothetical protein
MSAGNLKINKYIHNNPAQNSTVEDVIAVKPIHSRHFTSNQKIEDITIF